jgi:hypothetical protein
MSNCPHPLGHPDAAKRMSDGACLAWAVHEWDCVGKFMAFKLEDGSTNNDLYPRKRDAVRHNDEFRHCFIALHPGGMSPCEAEIMLNFHRNAYKAGFRLADPADKNGGRSLIPRIGEQEINSQISSLAKGR